MEPIRINSRYGYHPENGEILPLGDHPPLSARDPEARSIVHAVHQVQNLEEQFTQFINSIHIDAAPVRERLTQLIEEYIPDSIIEKALKKADVSPANAEKSTTKKRSEKPHRNRDRVVTTHSTEKPAAPAGPVNIEARHNVEKDGIEIKFSAKPDAAIIQQLKDKGYRFSRQGHWYCPYTHDGMQWAQAFATAPANAGAESITDTPPDRVVTTHSVTMTAPTPSAVVTTPTASSIMDAVNALFATKRSTT